MIAGCRIGDVTVVGYPAKADEELSGCGFQWWIGSGYYFLTYFVTVLIES